MYVTLYIDNSIIYCNNCLKIDDDLFSNFSRMFKIKYSEYFFRIYLKKKIENRKKQKTANSEKDFKRIMQKKY